MWSLKSKSLKPRKGGFMSGVKQIKEGIELYYDGLYSSDPAKVREIFHENARVAGYMNGELLEMTVEEFAGFVGSQQPSPQASDAKKFLEIESIETAGETACVLLRELYLGIMFFDTFSMLKVDGQWKIYNKLFFVEDE